MPDASVFMPSRRAWVPRERGTDGSPRRDGVRGAFYAIGSGRLGYGAAS
jgi:hypothetical protein